jgi:hypothetical protein
MNKDHRIACARRHWYNARVQLRGLSALMIVMSGSCVAQWLDYPTADLPRTSDGKVDFAAPAPRTPGGKVDLSGLWQAANPLPCDGFGRVCTDLPVNLMFFNMGTGLEDGLPYLPASKEKMAKKTPADDAYLNCISPGGPRMHMLPTMKKFVQTPSLLIILNEFNANFRQIFLDGRPLPEDPTPSWNGYSTGKWEGDTLVVQSNGYRDDQWLDQSGSPLTSAAKVTEKFRRPTLGKMEIDVTIDDPKSYARPFTVTLHQDLQVDTELLDAVCAENEKDVPHIK